MFVANQLERDELPRRTVASMVDSNGQWRWELITDFVPSNITQRLAATMPTRKGGKNDAPGWKWNIDRYFSVKSAYDMRQATSDAIPHKVLEVISKYRGILRVKIFLWLVANERLLTNTERVRLHLTTIFGSQNPWRALNSSFLINIGKRSLIRCSAKKKIIFMDQILDYIEGFLSLRRWYGAPELLPKDGSLVEDQEEDHPEDEIRDAVLVTDGDNEISQMVILSLIVKRIKVKALMKDKRSANEAFGNYVEVTSYILNEILIKKALRGVRAIICPNEGFLSSVVESFKGVEHIVLLSQLSAYRASSGIQAIMTSNQRKLDEEDESALIASRIPYTIIRAKKLQSTPGGTRWNTRFQLYGVKSFYSFDS
ncbi:uncharacterized protein LOC120148502 [Hibiscus syriacus]|uniref:uncharacterized protein LOC120148502 n=1 Tax=Hibiscus syriacus TaxID=106335 RepID=UPI0019223558|nr:uncharacterized protein LOC120148502 [Hibiscus syriacus]